MRMTPTRWSAVRLVLLVVVAGALLLAGGVTSGSAAAPIGARAATENTKSTKKAEAGKTNGAAKLQTYGIGPANAKGLDRRGTFVYSGRGGTVVEDQVALVNYTTKPQKVRVYASDAFTTDTGAYDVLADGTTSTGVGAWVDLEPRTVTIPARRSPNAVAPGTLIIPFTLTVPRGATPGDHAGGIVMSVRTKGAEGTNAVVVDRRVGTRVYVRVAGPLDPGLSLANLSVSYDGDPIRYPDGRTRISYTVRNSGNVVLSARQSVKVEGWLGIGGSKRAPAQPDLVQLLPGAAVNVSVVVDGVLPSVRPSAVVTLVPYQGTAEAPADLPSVSAAKAFWAVPWTLLALVLAVLVALVGWQFWRRRARAVGSHPTPDSTPELVNA